jgi:hypothetical protein
MLEEDIIGAWVVGQNKDSVEENEDRDDAVNEFPSLQCPPRLGRG